MDGVDVDAMDAEVPQEEDQEEWDGTEEMRKRKAQEYMDEVYGMDFNDMVYLVRTLYSHGLLAAFFCQVGDMPTRFKYAAVASHAYALTPAEMLLATDAELNEYMGIKKYAPYRKDGQWDAKRAGRLKELKEKLKGRSWGAGESDADGVESKRTRKRKGKKERQRAKAGGGAEGSKAGDEDEIGSESRPVKKRRQE